jgi:hypothetical protein
LQYYTRYQLKDGYWIGNESGEYGKPKEEKKI